MPAKPLDAKTAAANAVTTMAAVASTSGPAAKPRLTGKTLAPPPLSRPLASYPGPGLAGGQAGDPGTDAVRLVCPRSVAIPRPSCGRRRAQAARRLRRRRVPGPGARPESARPEGARAAGSGTDAARRPARAGQRGALSMRPTTGLSTAVPHPRERRPATPAGGSPGAIVDFVSLAPSSGPLLTQNPDAWGRRSPAPRSRVVLYGALAAALLAGGAAIAWKQWWSARPGRIEISTTPAGATVTLAGDPEAHRAPVAFEKPPGHYTISVARDGFQRDDRAVDLHAGQDVVLSIALAPVPAPRSRRRSCPSRSAAPALAPALAARRPRARVTPAGAPVDGASGCGVHRPRERARNGAGQRHPGRRTPTRR